MEGFATPRMRFQTPAPLLLEAAFDGGRITSDGGLPWLAEANRELGVCEARSRVRFPNGVALPCATLLRRWCASGSTKWHAATRTRMRR